MDKYEYKLKSDQIKKLYEERDFKTLLNIASSFDWKKISNNVLLNIVADAYEQEGRYDEACDLLLLAYGRTSFGRNLAYRLCLLSIKLGRVSEAVDFYTDFVRKAPKDPSQFILKYEILKAKNASIDELIKALEAYLLLDIDEKLEYELALLYHESGHGVKCIEMCNEIALWFGESEYVKEALELKTMYMPLTNDQEVKYHNMTSKIKPIKVEKTIEQEDFSIEEKEMLMDTIKTFDSNENENQENDESDFEEFFNSPINEDQDNDNEEFDSVFADLENKELQEFNQYENLNDENNIEDVPVSALFDFSEERESSEEVYRDQDMEELVIPEAFMEEEFEEQNTARATEVVESTEEVYEEEIESTDLKEDIEEQIEKKIGEETEEQIEGQITLEALLEEYSQKEEEAQRKIEEERIQRAALIAEKTRELREEIEKQNETELDGVFGDLFERELAESEEFANVTFESEEEPELESDFSLTPELKKTFERYLPINNMEEQLHEVLKNLFESYVDDGTSLTNNIVIMGDEKSGKTSLIIDIIKVVNKQRERTGRKVAKIKGESLNRKGMAETMQKLFGVDLIVERAGNLNPETVEDIIKTMQDYTENMIVILEDSEVAIERLFKVNENLNYMFNNVIKIKEVGVKEWVEVAKEYARRRGYIVDEMGTLALHVKIGSSYSRELKLETDEIEKIIDEAIEKSKRKKRYSKKYRIEGFAVLREADFM